MAVGAFFAQTCTAEEMAQIAAVEHTEAVLAQLEAEYDTAGDDVQRRQRERRRVQTLQRRNAANTPLLPRV
jgi:hypothetical protein